MFKQDCDIFTFFNLLFYIINKGGVYSNDHLNISHPMHRGGALTSIDPEGVGHHFHQGLHIFFISIDPTDTEVMVLLLGVSIT